jgi:hypothetical protein
MRREAGHCVFEQGAAGHLDESLGDVGTQPDAIARSNENGGDDQLIVRRHCRRIQVLGSD